MTYTSSPSSDLLNAFRVGVGMPNPAEKEQKSKEDKKGDVDE